MKKNPPNFFVLKSKLIALQANHSESLLNFMSELTEALEKTTDVTDRKKIKDLYDECSQEVTRMREQRKKLLKKPIGILSLVA